MTGRRGQFVQIRQRRCGSRSDPVAVTKGDSWYPFPRRIGLQGFGQGNQGIFSLTAHHHIHLVAGLQNVRSTEGGVGSADHRGDRRIQRFDRFECFQGMIDGHGHGCGADQFRLEIPQH